MRTFNSKNFGLSVVLLVLLAARIGSTAEAESPNPPDAPAGDYLTDCQGIKWTGPPESRMVFANCKTDEGPFAEFETALDYGYCAKGDVISNVDGILVCGDHDPGVPKGLYRHTCSIITWNESEGTLVTFCEQGVRSFLNYRNSCAEGSTVSVNHFVSGIIGCDTPSPGLPQGGYLNDCVVFDWNETTGLLQAVCSSSRNPESLQYSSACAAGSTVSYSQGALTCDTPAPG